jgi:hypothetical protein
MWYTPPRIMYLRRLSSCDFNSIQFRNLATACFSSEKKKSISFDNFKNSLPISYMFMKIPVKPTS